MTKPSDYDGRGADPPYPTPDAGPPRVQTDKEQIDELCGMVTQLRIDKLNLTAERDAERAEAERLVKAHDTHTNELLEYTNQLRAQIVAAVAKRDAAEAEVERLRMKAGKQQARCAVFMQAMSWLARNGQQERAQSWIKRADAAASDVRPEDFVVARPAGSREVKP